MSKIKEARKKIIDALNNNKFDSILFLGFNEDPETKTDMHIGVVTGTDSNLCWSLHKAMKQSSKLRNLIEGTIEATERLEKSKFFMGLK